jgi:hypothetical protein
MHKYFKYKFHLQVAELVLYLGTKNYFLDWNLQVTWVFKKRKLSVPQAVISTRRLRAFAAANLYASSTVLAIPNTTDCGLVDIDRRIIWPKESRKPDWHIMHKKNKTYLLWQMQQSVCTREADRKTHYHQLHTQWQNISDTGKEVTGQWRKIHNKELHKL